MKVIIFDMDGTLIDSAQDITITVNHVRACHHNLPPLTSESVVEMINRPKRNLAKLFYETQTQQSEDRELFETHYYQQCIQNPLLYPGIQETLQLLKTKEIKLSVATNAPSTFAKRMMNHLKIDHYFDHIIGPDIAGTSKPEPDMLQQILSYYGFNYAHDQAWMVGDNQKDMLAAQYANIHSIFATWGFSAEGKGDSVINTPQHILKIIH